MHVIKDVVNDQDGKAQEGMKELKTSWEGLTSSIEVQFLSSFYFSMYYQDKEALCKALGSKKQL